MQRLTLCLSHIIAGLLICSLLQRLVDVATQSDAKMQQITHLGTIKSCSMVARW